MTEATLTTFSTHGKIAQASKDALAKRNLDALSKVANVLPSYDGSNVERVLNEEERLMRELSPKEVSALLGGKKKTAYAKKPTKAAWVPAWRTSPVT